MNRCPSLTEKRHRCRPGSWPRAEALWLTRIGRRWGPAAVGVGACAAATHGGAAGEGGAGGGRGGAGGGSFTSFTRRLLYRGNQNDLVAHAAEEALEAAAGRLGASDMLEDLYQVRLPAGS